MPGAADSNERMSWRFDLADREGDWSMYGVELGKLHYIVDKLRTFESMRVSELFAPGSAHGKRYELAELPSRAR